MGNDVVTLRQNEVADVAQQPTTNLPSALELVTRLADAIGGMQADDITVEVNTVTNVNGSSSRFSLRAYRKGREVLNIDEGTQQ
jgi:hypothetical protein